MPRSTTKFGGFMLLLVLLLFSFQVSILFQLDPFMLFQSEIEDYVDFDNSNHNNYTLPEQLASNDTMKCFAWSPKADKWWGKNPEWEVTIEQDEQFCFTPMKDGEKAKFFHDLHQIQYNTSHQHCSGTTTFTKQMFSSGWGADISNVASGLIHGYTTKQPFQIKTIDYWHYAAKKKKYRTPNDKPVCKSGDMFCYFLPIGACPAVEKKSAIQNIRTARPQGQLADWATEYATRQQQWLRKEVYDYMKHHAPLVQTPCAAMHVRRSDAVIPGSRGRSRKYFPISSYIDMLVKYEKKIKINSNSPRNTKNILLFTDDQNAIEEAHEFHPEYNWMYLNKTRHRGSSGGWENQIPSGSPKDEVVAILTIFKLARKCDVFVNSLSGFADLIYSAMVETGGREVKRLEIDDNTFKEKVNNHISENELQVRLESLRKNITSTI